MVAAAIIKAQNVVAVLRCCPLIEKLVVRKTLMHIAVRKDIIHPVAKKCASQIIVEKNPLLLARLDQDPQQSMDLQYCWKVCFFVLHPLAWILHTHLLKTPGIMMYTLLGSHFDWKSRDTYSPVSKCSFALSHHVLLLPRHDQHEISWLVSNLPSC